MRLWVRAAIIAGLIACIGCLFFFVDGPFAQVAYWLGPYDRYLMMFSIPLGIPGMIFAMAVANNVHAFNGWIALVGNFVFYMVAIVLINRIVRRLRAR